jgi:hypothetical protein
VTTDSGLRENAEKRSLMPDAEVRMQKQGVFFSIQPSAFGIAGC